MARGKSNTFRSGKGPKKTLKARLQLRLDKPCGEELRKVLLLQIESVLESLRDSSVSPDAVHDARTYIKKIRSILRLASPVMSRKQREQGFILLSDAAVRLTPLRDSEVTVRTLDSLLELTGLPVTDYVSLRAGLVDIAKQRRRNDIRQIPKVLLALRKLRDTSKKWPIKDLKGSDLRRRVRRTYRRGRTALKFCRNTEDADSFHLWRKQVKQLWYQLRITSRFWEDKALGLITSSGAIGQMAGDERDLTLLGVTLRQGVQGKATTLLLEKIAGLLSSLRKEALSAGNEFYSVRPEQFVDDLKI